MKLNKKILGLVLGLGLTFGTASTTFAATNADFITALQNAGAPASNVSAVQTYLNNNNISAAKLDDAKAQVDKVVAILNAKGAKTQADAKALLTADEKNQVMAALNSAASDINAKVVFNGSIPSLVDGSGAPITTLSAVSGVSGSGVAMQQTGTNFGNFMVIGGVLVLGSLGAFALKRN